MAEKIIRQTKQKALILESIKHDATPLSADQILTAARKILPSIALTTVYRNLEQLVQQKVINRLIYPDGITRYQLASSLHNHQMVCLNCAKSVDISQCPLDCLSRQIETDTGFSITSHHLSIYGYCSECRQKKEKDTV